MSPATPSASIRLPLTRQPLIRRLPVVASACLWLAAALAGCQRAPATAPLAAPAAGARPVATVGPDDAVGYANSAAPVPAPAEAGTSRAPAPTSAEEAPATFDPATVPESTAALPPFPLFQAPEGLTGSLAGEREREFDRSHVIAGDGIIAVEGRLFTERYRLQGGARDWSELEFHRNYRDAIAALGGVEVSRVQFTPVVAGAFGGRAAVDAHYHGTCASAGCENHTYLIRQGGDEYWVQVSTGRIPASGQVAVLQRRPMASSLALVQAAEMKRAIDADGRIALQFNFATDSAALREGDRPLVEEITTLLLDDPALAVSVDGHTDASGSPARNRELSRQRAEAVRDALIARGIDARRLAVQGFGADRPLAGNDDEAGRARNRRVELVRRDRTAAAAPATGRLR
jgi:OOP family OmpA-OmpF porin